MTHMEILSQYHVCLLLFSDKTGLKKSMLKKMCKHILVRNNMKYHIHLHLLVLHGCKLHIFEGPQLLYDDYNMANILVVIHRPIFKSNKTKIYLHIYIRS
jgi:hypothetical protein